jgi:hypothetical protein
MLIACFDSVGSFLWSCSEAGTVINSLKEANDVVSIAGSGALYVGGNTDPSEGRGVIWKVDAIAHNIVWRKQVPDKTVQSVDRLCLSMDESIILAGTKNFDTTHKGCFLAKMDTSGTVLWTKTFDVGRAYVDVSDLKELRDGRIVLYGTTSDSILHNGLNDRDVFMSSHLPAAK